MGNPYQKSSLVESLCVLPDVMAFLCVDLMESGEFRLEVCVASAISISSEACIEFLVWPLERVEPAIGTDAELMYNDVSCCFLYKKHEHCAFEA